MDSISIYKVRAESTSGPNMTVDDRVETCICKFVCTNYM